MLPMDLQHLDSAGYLGVLVFVNIFYVSLMLILTWLVLHVRKNMTPARPNSEARQVSERSFWANFVFLQLTLFCKLITAVIILIHVFGLTSNTLPIQTLRLFYNASGLFLCIAYFINLY